MLPNTPGQLALIYQHSTLERQREIAAALDARVRADRKKIAEQEDGGGPSGADLVRDA